MNDSSPPEGLGATLRGALRAGALCGLVFGLFDGVVAAFFDSYHGIGGVSFALDRFGGAGGLVGCLAASVLTYSVAWIGGLVALGLVAHPLGLRRVGREGRRGALLALGLGLGAFVELYWWTRPFVFSGYPATSPERLGATAVQAVLGLGLGFGAARLYARVPGAVERAVAGAAGVAWLVGLGFLGLERFAGAERALGRIDDANRDLPNVLLIVVDALRSDVIGTYGSERVDTPVLDELAERGVVFENAFVQAPFTWASFGSILTGKYPRRHGLLKLKAGYTLRKDFNVTLPLHLKTGRRTDGGEHRPETYVGTAFLTGALSHGSGLIDGFDVYCEALLGHELVSLASRWSAFRSDLVLSILWTKAVNRLESDGIDYTLAGSTAERWLREEGDRRFVSMVHLYSTHTPYDPKPEFRERYVDPAYDGPVGAFYAHHRVAIERGEYELTPADVQQIRALYHAGVTQADAAIGSILDALEERGVLDDTLVIVTADHGEELGEHGVWEHNWMYDTNLRVPLILSWPGRLPEGKRVQALVETVDLFPTVCELVGLELPAHDPGDELAEYHRIDGTSLVALIDGEVEAVKSHVYAENGRFVSVQGERYKLIVPRGSAELDADAPSWPDGLRAPRLFDLVADPGETENLFEDRPEVVDELLAALRRWDAELPIPLTGVAESHRDEETEAHLRDLGYTDGIGVGEEP